MAWRVESGRLGDVKLDGLNFSLYANWPGAIHEGNGEALGSTRTFHVRDGISYDHSGHYTAVGQFAYSGP